MNNAHIRSWRKPTAAYSYALGALLTLSLILISMNSMAEMLSAATEKMMVVHLR